MEISYVYLHYNKTCLVVDQQGSHQYIHIHWFYYCANLGHSVVVGENMASACFLSLC